MPDHRADSRALLAGLVARIRREGMLSVEAYMEACLGHPLHGYYRKPRAIGAAGDFVTAPEISQVFGELIGLWCAVTWERMGSPAPLRLVELGPGRGTLMCDALRAAKVAPGFLAAASVHLVEISPALRRCQREALARGNAAGRPKVAWHETLEAVPAGPAIVIANEFLDALPIRQLIYDGSVWRERVVTLGADGSLKLAAGDPVHLTSGASRHLGGMVPADGAIVELRPGEERLLAVLAARTDPLVALFIDYGPGDAAAGDTLQGVRGHAYADPLEEPGSVDLTAHVQFSALAGKARAAGLAANGPITQAELLGRLGIVERTARLMAANPSRAGEIEAATQRLMSPSGMGQLFKSVAVHSPSLPAPPGFG